MTALNTVALVAFALDPAVVLAVWTLACLTAVAVVLVVAWLLQPRTSDPFGGDRPRLVTTLFTTDGHTPRHALRDRAAWRPAHTLRSVAHRGRHHTGERRLVASLIDTQAVTPAADLLAAVHDLQERAA